MCMDTCAVLIYQPPDSPSMGQMPALAALLFHVGTASMLGGTRRCISLSLPVPHMKAMPERQHLHRSLRTTCTLPPANHTAA